MIWSVGISMEQLHDAASQGRLDIYSALPDQREGL